MINDYLHITHEEMGICAEIPGVQRAIDHLEAYKQSLLAKLANLRAARGDGQIVEQARRKGRPPKALAVASRSSGWSDDPEERKREMARRMAVHAAKKKLHPRNSEHPEHAAWLAKMRRIQQQAWSGMTPQQRKERIRKMAAGRNKKPVVKLAEAS